MKRDYLPSQLSETVEDYERVDHWLNQWSKWMRGARTKLGYPSKAVPFIGGGESQRTAEWEEDAQESIWLTNCRAMDALIDSLPPTWGCAVHHIYLGAVYRFPREDVLSLLAKAMGQLREGMNERAIL